MLTRDKKIHFVGIGGTGMSGLAQLLIRQDFRVSGSDIKSNFQTERVRALGAEVFIGHVAAHAEGADVVTYSSAVDSSNPEVAFAFRQKIPLLKRAELLSLLMEDKISILVAGAHGKTTTTSMISLLLKTAGLDPTVAIGGEVEDFGGNAYLGTGDYFVAEADESDGSFLHFAPTYSVVTNIDREHMDFYKDMPALEKCFADFIGNTKAGGCCFWCHNDARLRKIINRREMKAVGFGLKKDPAGIYAEDIEMNAGGSEFRVIYKDNSLGRIELRVPGRHNISNALAAAALGCELGLGFNIIKEALSGFRGVGRRFETKACLNDILIVDDYAHHPTEIKATLAAAREYKRRIVAVFQPHRYTRTRDLREAFVGAFDLADYLILTDIYAASEKPIEGVSSEALYRELVKRRNHIELIHDKQEIAERLLGIVSAGDLVITLGAGDVNKVGEELSDRIGGR